MRSLGYFVGVSPVYVRSLRVCLYTKVYSHFSRSLEEPLEDSFGYNVLAIALRSFFMPALRFVNLRMLSGVLGKGCLIVGLLRRPPIGGGGASSKVVSGWLSCPLQLCLAAVSAI